MIRAIRGMNDILPSQSYHWQSLEKKFADCLAQYGYQEIRLPIVESTALFKRTIGEVTDIVEKEMYTFTDLNGDSLTLRPEGTAGCVRACLEHGLLHHQQQKLWYCGPMFRHEKPQRGRYRQFYQLGVETFGFSDVSIDLELMAMCQRLWKMLGLSQAVHLQINSLGTLNERQHYRTSLVDYLELHLNELDEDSKNRLHKNPLRILDSKNPGMQSLIAKAPQLIDALGHESRDHFERLCQGLERLGIEYTINPFLVRGLDYYGQTVFEWVTEHLGSQSTVCAGGRYDLLVEQLGGKSTPAAGFALGIERLLLLQETLQRQSAEQPHPLIFFIAVGEEAIQQALVLAESIRNHHSALSVFVNTAGGSFKSQFKKADKSGAKLALILGEDEMQEKVVGIKDLRAESAQFTVSHDEIFHYIDRYLER